MSRNIVQDVVPPDNNNRRTIRSVSIDRRRKAVLGGGQPISVHTAKPSEQRPSQQRPFIGNQHGGPMAPHDDIQSTHTVSRNLPPGKRRNPFGVTGLFAIVVGILFLLFGISMLFSGARVSIVVKEAAVTIDGTFITEKNPESGALGYQVVTLSEDGKKVIPATGREVVQTRASGRIMIYNEYSSSGQRLITNTRFETQTGLIFRIARSVVVPGQTVVNGKTVPGSIEVEVFADAPGEKFNIDKTDFVIPGFRGDPRYSKFYARSVTPMTGGFSGEVAVAKESDVTAARNEIRNSIRSSLIADMRAQAPDGFILFDDGVFIEYTALPNRDGKDATVEINERVTVHGMLLDRAALASFIAKETIAKYDGTSVVVKDYGALTFSIPEKAGVRLAEDEQVTFSLAGNPMLVWTYDKEKLAQELAGAPKSEGQAILSKYSGIDRAEIVVRPFWKKYFPDRASRIKIEDVPRDVQ